MVQERYSPFFGVDVNEHLAKVAGDKKSDRTWQWITKRYAKWWISDDYNRTSGVNICNKSNPAQVVHIGSCYIMIKMLYKDICK